MADTITAEQIIEAITGNEGIASTVTTHIIQSDKGQEIIGNRADTLYKDKIREEVKTIYDRMDQEAFDAIGEKPEVDADGRAVEKTYAFYKSRLEELKTLRDQKGALTVDAEVKRLTKELEKARQGGGGAHWEQTYNTAKTEWQKEKDTLTGRITELEGGIYSSAVQNQLAGAKAQLKFNPDVPQSAIDAMYGAIAADLTSKSKKDGDKIIFLKADGSAITDDEYKPADALFILKDRMKDVLLKTDVPGGGAQETVVGSIKTTTVEGKDEKSLVLDTTKFANRVEFQKVAKEALKAEGISTSNPLFQPLLDKAYKTYEVDKLPRS